MWRPCRTGRGCTASRCRRRRTRSPNWAAPAICASPSTRRPPPARPARRITTPELPRWERGEDVATRNAFGEALAALGAARDDVVALDGEVGDSTRLEYFAKEHPERYIECYIAEQQMVAGAVGVAARGWLPFASTFAAFLTRAHDFVRMAAVSGSGLNLVGSHAASPSGRTDPARWAWRTWR